jgi:hypothetical protein
MPEKNNNIEQTHISLLSFSIESEHQRNNKNLYAVKYSTSK